MLHSSKDWYCYGNILVILLEYFEGNRSVLDGNNDPAVIQVQDVMLLLENLQKEKKVRKYITNAVVSLNPEKADCNILKNWKELYSEVQSRVRQNVMCIKIGSLYLLRFWKFHESSERECREG